MDLPWSPPSVAPAGPPAPNDRPSLPQGEGSVGSAQAFTLARTPFQMWEQSLSKQLKDKKEHLVGMQAGPELDVSWV